MEFDTVLAARRTVRDFASAPVSDETLRKILAAAFYAPTNDHLRQFEFVIVRDPATILNLTATVAHNTTAIQETFLKAAAPTVTISGVALLTGADVLLSVEVAPPTSP